MAIYAFKDDRDGYYQVDILEGETFPEWTSKLTPCEAQVAAPHTAQVPASVTMRQARLALLQAGLLTQVNTAIAGMPGAAGDAARIAWEFAGDVQRSDALLAQLTGALGFSDAQLDDLFRLAATL